jgi:lambda repressor-like predicted transcriptional regulator
MDSRSDLNFLASKRHDLAYRLITELEKPVKSFIKLKLRPDLGGAINVSIFRQVMTPERRQARIAMLKQGKAFAGLARETGFSPATIHATLSNTCRSVKARQAIVNALQIELWGLRPTEVHIDVPASAGLQFEYPKKQQAIDAAAEFGPDVVSRRGRTITFIKPMTFVFKVGPQETQSTKNRS